MSQYCKGEYVNYAANGVCLVSDIGAPDFDRSAKELYYILRPIGDKATTVFVPVKNEILLSRMRKLLTKEEIDGFIGSVKDETIVWISDRKKRTELFEGIIKGNDILEILRLIGCLYLKRQELSRQAGNKRLAFSDQDVLERAERLIEDEFPFVLGIPKNDVAEYIKNRIEA